MAAKKQKKAAPGVVGRKKLPMDVLLGTALIGRVFGNAMSSDRPRFRIVVEVVRVEADE